MPTPLPVLSSHSRTLLPLKGSPGLCERVCKLLESFEKIVKEEYSGNTEYDLWTFLSGTDDSVTGDIEVPSSSQAS